MKGASQLADINPRIQQFQHKISQKTARLLTDADILLSTCIFLVFLWSFLDFFNKFPSYILGYSLPEIVGIAAYNFTFALFESSLYFLMIFLVLSLIALCLPDKWLGDHLALVGSGLAIILAARAMFGQFNYSFVAGLSPQQKLFSWIIIGLVFLLVYALLITQPKFRRAWRALLKRLSVLSAIYVFFGLVGLVIVIIRNLFLKG